MNLISNSITEIKREDLHCINGRGDGWTGFWRGAVVTAGGAAGAYAGAIIGGAVSGLGAYVGSRIIGL